MIFQKDTSNNVIAGTLTTWVGVVSGSTITNLILKAGTEPVGGYPSGENSVVMATPTAAWADSLVDGILTHADQDGTLKAGAVDNAGVLASDVVTSTKVAQNAIQPDDLATNAITLGYAQITSNQTGIGTTPTQVTNLSLTVTIPAGGRRIKITVFAFATDNTVATASTFLDIWDGTVGSGTRLAQSAMKQPVATSGGFQMVVWSGVPAAGSKTYNVALSGSTGLSGIYATATAPTFILVEAI